MSETLVRKAEVEADALAKSEELAKAKAESARLSTELSALEAKLFQVKGTAKRAVEKKVQARQADLAVANAAVQTLEQDVTAVQQEHAAVAARIQRLQDEVHQKTEEASVAAAHAKRLEQEKAALQVELADAASQLDAVAEASNAESDRLSKEVRPAIAEAFNARREELAVAAAEATSYVSERDALAAKLRGCCVAEAGCVSGLVLLGMLLQPSPDGSYVT